MKKEDIILKKGDKVYFTKYGENGYLIVDGYDGSTIKEFEEYGAKITKIERPVKCETIYEAPKEILDKEEKEYLEAVVRPFKERVLYIKKESTFDRVFHFISIILSTDNTYLPYFKPNTMYKGMKLGKQYTLKELGLFQGE